jgi:ribosomal protein S27AE
MSATFFTYWCPSCGDDIRAERFSQSHITCPSCGDGPFETEHECNYDPESGDEFCADYLVRVQPGEPNAR